MQSCYSFVKGYAVDDLTDCKFVEHSAHNLHVNDGCHSFLQKFVSEGSTISWVPSHGEKLTWYHQRFNPVLCRRLNQLADRAASLVHVPSEYGAMLTHVAEWECRALDRRRLQATIGQPKLIFYDVLHGALSSRPLLSRLPSAVSP